MRNKWLYRLVLGLCLLGIGIQIYPILRENRAKEEQERQIQSFVKSREAGPVLEEGTWKPEGGEPGGAGPEPGEGDALYTQMKEYNERICRENQSGLKDVFSYEQNPFDLSALELEEDMIGYLEIETLDLILPLYIGASKENMRKGAVVLAETSMPIGGKDTNCAIAAHRGGANGDQSFKNIEQLKAGDEIRITNAWETLTYVAAEQVVIEPNDVEAIKIIPGQDMITLFTCHPYGFNSHRYVVYAKRKEAGQEEEAKPGTEEEGAKEPVFPESLAYEPSGEKIEQERKINAVALGCSVLITVVIIGVGIKDRFGRK